MAFFSPIKVRKRKPAAVAPAAKAAVEPALLMPNEGNLLTAPAAEAAAAAMPNTNNMWHPNTGFKPNRKNNMEAAARRAATLHSYVARTNAAVAGAAAGGAGRGPSAAALISNMSASPVRPRPRLHIPNNGPAAAGAGVNYVSPATTSSPPPKFLYPIQPIHEHAGPNDEFVNVSLTSSHRNGAAAAAANAGKSPRRASRRAARKSRKSRKTRRT